MTGRSKIPKVPGLDPRTKLILVACFSSMAVLLNHMVFLAGIFSMALLLLSFLGVGLAGMWRRAKAFFAVVLLISLLQSVFGQGGEVLVQMGSLRLITTGGLMLAGEFILRMLIILTSAGILTTCGSREVIQGMVQWKLPYEIAFMAVLGLRFLPVFAEEFRDARTAIELRGIDMKELSLQQKLQVHAGLLQPVAAGALLKARDLSLSIEMREFRAFPQRVSYRELRLKQRDYTVMIAAGLLTTATIVGYYLWI